MLLGKFSKEQLTNVAVCSINHIWNGAAKRKVKTIDLLNKYIYEISSYILSLLDWYWGGGGVSN